MGLVAARAAGVVALGHHFGCVASDGEGSCDCGTAERAGHLVAAVVEALGVQAVPADHVRLTLDLPGGAVDHLLRDLKWINEAEARMTRQAGHEWVLPLWRSVALTAAAAALVGSGTTHRFSHSPRSLLALRAFTYEYSTKQASEVLGCTTQNVCWMCRHQALPARRLPGGRRAWVLDGEAVDALAAKRGRPPGVPLRLVRATTYGDELT